MGSVIATWKGQCPDRGIQGMLLAALGLLARRQVERWDDMPTPRPRFSDLIAARRAEGLPERPTLRTFDQELTGHILVRTDIAEDPHGLLETAAHFGLAHEPEAPGAQHALIHLDRLIVRGFDVRLFDPRELYPGEDRLSFVFIESETAPFLNGRLAALTEPAICALSHSEVVRQADWYIECPYVHLRYYLEDWLDRLMAWIRYFFISDLQYWRYESWPGYAQHREAFQALREQAGFPRARLTTLTSLLAEFDHEADQWRADLKHWATTPTPDSVRVILLEWELISHDDHIYVWQNDDGDGLSIQYHPLPPGFAASLDDPEAVRAVMRAEAAEAGAGLVEVDVIEVEGLAVIRAIIKKPQQPSGMTYEGELRLLRRDFSFAIKVLCRETGVTGLRDDAVFVRWSAEHGTPGEPSAGWFQDPYDAHFEGPVLRNPADDPEWDQRFPDHPLSRCRAHMQMLEERISWKAAITDAAAFVEPA